jgi:hypothetical protein
MKCHFTLGDELMKDMKAFNSFVSPEHVGMESTRGHHDTPQDLDFKKWGSFSLKRRS